MRHRRTEDIMYPFINVFGISIPTYGLCFSLGLLLALLISYIRIKKAGLNVDKFLNLAVIVIFTGMICAYLLYIFVTYPISEIIHSITSGSFAVFKELGLVFYGGLIGGVVSGVIYCVRAKLRFFDYAAVIVPVIPLAHAVGRIGCFLAGCCFGKVVDTPISVYYSHPAGGAPTGVPVFPIQLVEAALNLIIFAILLIYTRRSLKKYSVLPLYLGLYSIVRFGVEFGRADEFRGIWLGLSTSQWISILLLIASVVLFIVFNLREKRGCADTDESDRLNGYPQAAAQTASEAPELTEGAEAGSDNPGTEE